jgi:DNA-binding response OmpR family regulator
VTTVDSIAAARAAVSADGFDAVLVDYDLDDGKGDVLVGWLSSLASAPVVVAISSHQAGNDALLRAGATAVCPKLRFDQIATVLGDLLRH